MKKSPLAMLVETCSNIGQELSRTTRPMETAAISTERRKINSCSSVSPPHHSKSTTPVSSNSSPKSHHLNRTLKSIRNLETNPVNPLLLQSGLMNPNINGGNIAAAAQYQLIYQQLLYQAELEYMKTQELFAKSSMEKAKLCSICCLTPGYMGGPCIHTELSAATGSPVNPLLAMLTNPLTANRQSLVDTSRTIQQASTSAKSPSMKTSGHQLTNPFPRTKSPKQNKECHWVDGARGYCGKKFTSQEELMDHLRHHVTNTTTAEKQGPTKSISSHHRFQPYSLLGRGLAPPLQN